MNGVIDKRFPFAVALLIVSIMVSVSLLFVAHPSAGAEDTALGAPVTDPLGVASFMPPRGWIRWDFWGATAFSPTSDHNPKVTFRVNTESGVDEGRADTAMRDYVRTFSSGNYTLIERENLYLNGWPGIRILAAGTEKNTLFGPDYVWIQEYFTDRTRISLVFRADPASFETYRDTVLKSFRSLVIVGDRQHGP